MTEKNAAAKRRKAQQANEHDDTTVSLSVVGGSSTGPVPLHTFEAMVDKFTGEVLRGVPQLEQSPERDEAAPANAQEHVRRIQARHSTLHQCRLVAESRKEEKKEAASRVELADRVLEGLFQAQRESDRDETPDLPGVVDTSPEGMQRAISAAYERLAGARLVLANAKAASKGANLRVESAMYQLERAIRGEWGLPFAVSIIEEHSP